MLTVAEARELTIAKKNKRIQTIKNEIDAAITKAGSIGRNYATYHFNDDVDIKDTIRDYYINLGFNYYMSYEVVDKRVTANITWDIVPGT